MRILEVCVDLDGGGIDRYLYNYCTRITDIQFDFVIIKKNKEGILEKELNNRGYNIYKTPRMHDGIINNFISLFKIMRKGKYDIIHCHLGDKSIIVLFCAILCNIKIRIVHAHIANINESIVDKVLRKIRTFFVKKLATVLAACGIDAAIWVWGSKEYYKNKVYIHNNAIPTDKYMFSIEKRNNIRKKMDLSESTFIVGHVGRICEQKNQRKLIDIYSIIKKNIENSCLILIGTGDKIYEIKEYINKLGLENNVKLLGVRDDVNELLNIMDVFIFPSLYEGLPFTLIEVQCNGLPCVCSDTISRYVKITNNLLFQNLNDANEIWAKNAIELSKNGHDVNTLKIIQRNGYDIEQEAEKLRLFYIKLLKNVK